MPTIHVPKRTYTVRPYRFSLRPDHPLGQGLVFAGLGNVAGSNQFYDSSGLWNHSQLEGGVFWDVNRLEFDGVEGSQVTFKAPLLDYPITIACWVKPSVLNIDHTFVQIGDSSSFFRHCGMFGTPQNQLAAKSRNETNNQAASTTNFGANEVCHSCGTFNSSTDRSIYFNAIKEATNNELATAQSWNNTWLGQYGAGALNIWNLNGQIWDVLIYDRILSQQEIRQLANPDNVMLSGLVREAPKPKSYFFPAEVTPTYKSTIFRSRTIRGNKC